jgi:hypothetical protein
MDCIHRLPIDSASMPPADLCMMMYFHPQGGASISDLMVCHSVDDYLASRDGSIVISESSLTDKKILRMWAR